MMFSRPSVLFSALLVQLFALRCLPLAVAAANCATDSDCQLNGVCQTSSGTCACDPGWEGDQCGVLKLIPAPKTAFFQQPGVYTWGGSILLNEPNSWHMWHSEIAGNCTLKQWRTTSQIRHATASSAIGPWTPQEVVVTPEAHNPQVARLKDDTLILFDSYGGYDSHWQPCKHTGPHEQGHRAALHVEGNPPCNNAGPGNLTIHVLLPVPNPTWQRRSVPIDYPCRSCNLTPSPVVVNNTVYVMLHCDPDDTHHICDLTMVKATDPINGPYERVNDRVWDSSEAPGHPEDPGMWVDKRGNWHALLHNGPHGLHLWSSDGGKTFHTTNKEPYPFTVNVTVDFSSKPVTLGRRERPVMFLDKNGLPYALVTSAEGEGPTFTLVQMIQTS